MNANRLIVVMAKIARQLITPSFRKDFDVHDKDAILKSEGKLRFIWQIRETGTWLYLYTSQEWEKRLIERIDFYKKANISNIYFIYDKKKLIPIFENDLRYLAQKRIDAKSKNIKQDDTHIYLALQAELGYDTICTKLQILEDIDYPKLLSEGSLLLESMQKTLFLTCTKNDLITVTVSDDDDYSGNHSTSLLDESGLVSCVMNAFRSYIHNLNESY